MFNREFIAQLSDGEIHASVCRPVCEDGYANDEASFPQLLPPT